MVETIEGRDQHNMPEVDPVTGMPKIETEKKSEVEKFNRLDGQRSRSDQLLDDLSSEKGTLVLNKIKEHLLARVNKLIDEDGECRALKRLVVDMGVTINIGEVAIEKLMKMVSRKQTP